MTLEPFQRHMVASMYAGATETLILLPKKNGKSTLLGALALFHLCTTPDSECVIAAASRDQAQIMLRQAQGFIRRSPWLAERLLVKQREIVHRTLGGRVRVLASDVDTADGVIPTLALVDELHRHKSADLYGVFRDGLGPREGKMVTISTAGSAADSPLGVLRRQAHELPTFKRDGVRNSATSADGAFVMHEWCLAPDDDQSDLKLVAQANPASWQTIAALARRKNSPSMTPWQWARFACGVWTEGDEPWIDPAAWDACGQTGGAHDIPDGARVYLGVDLGVRHDSTAISVVWPRDDGLYNVGAEIISPAANGGKVELDDVEDRLRDLADRFTVVACAYDPWSFRRSAELLEREGMSMFEHPMGAERMHLASANLYRLIDEGLLVHDGNPELRAHVLAGHVKETERGWRLTKDPKSRRPIDALIALAIACSTATALDEVSTYNDRDLMVLS